MTSTEDVTGTIPETANQNAEVANMPLREYIRAHRTAHINSILDQGEDYIKLFRQQAAHLETHTREYYDGVLQSLREEIELVSNEIEASKPTQKHEPTPIERPRQRPRRQQPKKTSPVKVDSPVRPRRTRRRKK